METKITQQDEAAIITVDGRVDTVTAVEFEKNISPVLDSDAKTIILDCSGLEYISSSGLRVFLMMQKRMTARQGKLHLCGLRPNIKEIFDISGFSSIFKLFDRLEDAL